MGLPKIKKPTELRERLFETLEQNTSGKTFLIPHKTGSSILIDEESHNEMLDKIDRLKAINQGLQDVIDGNTHTHTEIRSFLKKKKSQWIKRK